MLFLETPGTLSGASLEGFSTLLVRVEHVPGRTGMIHNGQNKTFVGALRSNSRLYLGAVLVPC